MLYELSDFQVLLDEKGQYKKGKYAENCKTFFATEQEEMGDETKFEERIVVITQTCLLVFSPEGEHKGRLEFWATLQSLERIRRNLNNPNIVALQWRSVSSE